MEWLSNNWPFVIGLIIALVGNLLMYAFFAGKSVQKFNNLETKVDEGFEILTEKVDNTAEKFDEHVEAYNKHVGDPDIHVNRNLRDLFDSRFKLIEEIQRNTRTDVGRLQKTLDDM